MIPQDFITQVLDRTEIVGVIDGYVQLKKMGRDMTGLCPFHKEKTPSFTVSPTKQFYHCFGCGAHGNAINFMVHHIGMSFPEAVRKLAADAGLAMPEENEEVMAAAKTQREQDDLLEAVATFYRRQLRVHPQVLAYAKARGLNGETVARFGLGYAPPAGALVAAFPNDHAKLAEFGLLQVQTDTGEMIEHFRDRWMFPVRNAKGRLIGFGGRIMHDREGAGGKYINSPESELFQKRRELYGFSEAMPAIRQAGYAIVVEGYLDVLTLHQHGVENVVAGMGTAFTNDQLAALFRVTRRVVFCFDGDAAGAKAGRRALDLLLPAMVEGKMANFFLLPKDEDPDDFVRRVGAETFLAQLDEAPTALDYLFSVLQREHSVASPEGKAAFIAAARDALAKVASPLLRATAAARLAEIVQIDPGLLNRSMVGKVVAPVGATPSLARILLRSAVFDPVAGRALADLVVDGADGESDTLRTVIALICHHQPETTEALVEAASETLYAERIAGLALAKADWPGVDHARELQAALAKYRAQREEQVTRAASLAALRAQVAQGAGGNVANAPELAR